MKIATAAEMAELDRLAAEEYGLPMGVLMEEAGRRVAEAAVQLLGEVSGRRVVLFCGSGNNGGDGLAAARILREMGARPLAFALGPPDKARPETRANLASAAAAGVEVRPLLDAAALEAARLDCSGAGLIVDALFGTGFRPPARGLAADLIDVINGLGIPVLAVDIPSGLSADDGRVPGAAIAAAATVTFGLPKPGLLLHPGARFVGRLWLADIGFPPALIARMNPSRNLLTAGELSGLIRPRDPEGHKGTYGHALIVAGSRGLVGAALLAARGALRGGAGLVTVALPESLATPTLDALPEAMVLPLPEGDPGALGSRALEAILPHLEGKQSVAIGPGLSRAAETTALVRDLIPRIRVPLVLDADALAALVGLRASPFGGNAGVVMTPHPGELARLLGLRTGQVQEDRVGSCLACARDFGVVVALKGARTLVGTPAGTVSVNPTGNPGMAAGGMGDVLTGVIAALLAQGHDALPAALLGVFLHGLAGDRAAAARGPWGFLAGEVADEVPPAIRTLLNTSADAAPPPRALSLLIA